MTRRKTGGRKAGTKNRRTVQRIQRLEEGALLGLSPLEVMLDNMRRYAGQAQEISAQLDEVRRLADKIPPTNASEYERIAALATEELALRRVSQEFANDAAELVHPKLRQTEVAGPGRGAIPIKIEVEYVRAEARPAD